MKAAATAFVLIILVVGTLIGWHANRAHAAHGDLRTTRKRLPGYRKTRLRSGILAIVMFFVALMMIRGLIGH
jgi:phosphotransferase system  glucose/maltose/N-acetylglucosamine-specific IIC component